MRKHHSQLQRRKNPERLQTCLPLDTRKHYDLLSRERASRNQVVPENKCIPSVKSEKVSPTQREAPHNHPRPELWSRTWLDHLHAPPGPHKTCASKSYIRRSQHRSWHPGNSVTGPEGYFVPRAGVPRWGREHQRIHCPDQESGEQEGGALSVSGASDCH